MVMKILDLHQVISRHDNDSNNILIQAIDDERNSGLFPVDNYEAKDIRNENKFKTLSRKSTGESARFSFRNIRNFVINKDFDDGVR